METFVSKNGDEGIQMSKKIFDSMMGRVPSTVMQRNGVVSFSRIFNFLCIEASSWPINGSLPIGKSIRHLSTISQVDFREAKDWQDLRSMLFNLKENIQLDQIALAMNTLKRSHPSVPMSFLEEIRDLVLKNGSDLKGPRELSDILHSCAKLKFSDVAFVKSIGESVIQKRCHIQEFDNRSMATLIYSLGLIKASLSGVERMNSVFVDLPKVVCDEMVAPEREMHLNPQSLVLTLYGLGLLRQNANPEGIQKLIRLAFHSDLLSELNEQYFSMLISAMDDLKIKSNDDIWQSLKTELEKTKRREGLSSQGLCNVLRRLCIMQFPHREILESLALESVRERRINAYNGQDLANLIHSIAVYDLKSAELLPHFETRAIEPNILRIYKEYEICNVIYGFALDKPEGKDALFDTLIKEATRMKRLPHYTPQGLAMLIYSLGLVKFHKVPILEKLGKECIKPERLDLFTEQGLSIIIYGLGCLRIQASTLKTIAGKLLKEASEKERIKAFNEQALANIIYSLAQLKMPLYLYEFVSEVCQPLRVSKLNDQGLSNIIQALGWLHYKTDAHVRVLLGEAMQRGRSGTFSPLAQSNIEEAVVRLDPKFEGLVLPFLKQETKKTQLEQQSSEELISLLHRYFRNGIRDERIVKPVLQKITTKSKIEKLTFQHLADLLKILWKFGMSTSPAVPKIVKAMTDEHRREQITSKGLADAITALHWLRYSDQKMVIWFCQEFIAKHHHQNLNAEKLVTLLRALKGSELPSHIPEIIIEHLGQDLKTLKTRHLVELVQFHSLFGIRSAQSVERYLNEMIQNERLIELSLRDLSLTLDAVLSLDLQDLKPISVLVEAVDRPALFVHCRAHYLSMMIIHLCRLGKEYKKKTLKLIEKLVSAPWDSRIGEKDLTDVLKVVKEVDYEYGKLGALLNKIRRETRQTVFLKQAEMEKVQAESDI